MSSPHTIPKCSVHIFNYSLIILIIIHIHCVGKIQTLNDKLKLRLVTSVPERFEDGGNNGSFEVDDFTIASLSTMRLHIKKATECFVKRKFQHTCQASVSRLLNGNS
jgi:hypothetical protein